MGVRARERRASVDFRDGGRTRRDANKVDFPTRGGPIKATFPSILITADLMVLRDSSRE